MHTDPVIRKPSERGSALLLTMIMLIIILGLTTSLFTLTESIARDRASQEDAVVTLETDETGLAQVLEEIQRTTFTLDENRYAGYIESLGLDGPDYADVTGTANGNPFLVRVRSISLAHKLGTVPATYMQSAFDEDTVDIYELTAVSGRSAASDTTRGIQLIVRLQKRGLTLGDITPLYLDGETEADIVGQMSISGRDHEANIPAENCPTCGGTGYDPNCETCGGAGTYIKAKKTWDCNCVCPTCGGGGGDNPGGGQPKEEDYLLDPDEADPAKAAVSYPGSYEEINFKGQTEAHTYTEVDDGAGGTTIVYGEDAFMENKLDLRQIAALFTGGPASTPLQPTRNDAAYQAVDGSGTFKWDDLGTTGNMKVTYVTGDTGTLSTHVKGAGVLIIEGDAHFSGRLQWTGLVICFGTLDMSGGGNTTSQVCGSVMVGGPKYKLSGNVDIWWSSQAIQQVLEDLALDDSVEVDAVQACWREIVPDEDLVP